MGKQLDIVALEPFYGGVRKQTLELLSRHSRHRWTVFKLPARRLERRLSTAAQWFTQQIARTPHLKCDVLFTSDAMNLADFLRLNPTFGHKPSVAYFYCNQLEGQAVADQQARLALLSTISSATEVWFNSLYHMRGFLSHAAALYDAHPELGGKQPLRDVVGKSQLIHPPVEIVPPARDSKEVDAERKGRTLCLDNREGADSALFIGALQEIANRREPVALHILGRPLEGIPEGIPTTTVDMKNEADVVRALRRCEIYISAHPCMEFEPLAMRAMACGCIPILLKEGFYSEFLPSALHSWCLYDRGSAEMLNRIMDLWYLRRPAVARKELDCIFERYIPIQATRNFDKRMEYLVEQHHA